MSRLQQQIIRGERLRRDVMAWMVQQRSTEYSRSAERDDQSASAKAGGAFDAVGPWIISAPTVEIRKSRQG
jgi:hypothetical protein